MSKTSRFSRGVFTKQAPPKPSWRPVYASRVVALAAVAACGSLLAQPPAFREPVNYPAGPSPTSIAVADFNNDGRADLVVANLLANTVSVLLGNGDGTFQERAEFPAGGGSSVAVGDLNGDGNQDLVTVSGSSVAVLLGNGDGTFQSSVLYSAGFTDYVGVADFNQDGRPDVVAAGEPDSISLLEGRGDGTLLEPRFYGMPRPGKWGVFPAGPITVADVHGDGVPDVVVKGWDIPGYNAYLCVFSGPSWYFDYPEAFPVERGQGHVAVGDFNGDYIPDTAAGGWESLFLLLGYFQNPALIGPTGGSMVVADFNGDGNQDLAIRDPSTVRVLPGNGDGTFQPPAHFPAGGSVGYDRTLVVGDFNGDGKPDLATLANPDGVAVLINNTP